jgi:hypothetical protein
MTTATTSVVKHDTVTPADPFDMGSGRVDLHVAGSAQLTFDESPANYFAMANDPINAVNLNVPSVNAPVMPGELTTTRVATNVSGSTQRFTVSTSGAGGAISVSPKKFTLANGASQTLTITISAKKGGQQFGAIRITPDVGTPLHLPVAFVFQQGNVSLMEDCTPAQITVGGATTCEVTAQNNSFNPATVNFEARANDRLSVTGADGGATVVNPHKVTLNGVVLDGAQLGVPSMDPGSSPAGGYLPLDLFGVTPIPIGDEDILNFNVPPFVFNGKTYSTIGVDSNGYAVVGGGTSEDNNCCLIPGGPDPARPNNVLAPFWTDLDGTGAPGIFATVLTDGVNSWLVLEWRVNVFGTTSTRIFQTWIGIDGFQDISYTYSAAQASPSGQDFLVGAENEAGDGDMTAVLPDGSDQVISSTDPTPGDSVTFHVFLNGTATGVGKLTTRMTTDIVPGVTIVSDSVKVKAGGG